MRIAHASILLASSLALGAMAWAHPHHDDGAHEATLSEKWVKTEENDRRVLVLSVATREYEPTDGVGPRVSLAGAIHIADRRYYRALQEYLDAHDLVLYEGVGPSGVEHDTDEVSRDSELQRRTKNRLRLIGVLAGHFREYEGREAESLDELLGHYADDPRFGRWTDRLADDAWGNDWIIEEGDGGHRSLVSLGADGKPGGRGFDKDLRLADQPPITQDEIDALEPDGIQAKLARTLRLSFQLDEMDHSGENWVNSDMTVDQVQAAVERRTGGRMDAASVLFGIMDGSSLLGQLSGAALGLIDAIPGAAVRMRAMLMLVLGDADKVFEGGMPIPGGEALLDVILNQRNDIVLADLREAIDEHGDDDEIAVIYGAAHLTGVEEGLLEQGYELVNTEWRPAIKLNLRRAGISESEMEMLRQQVAMQMDTMEVMNSGN
ncbi:MAG: type II secretion system protein GspG [Planctomycetota bacterium]